ncbi:MAG: hypothetical protein COX16_16240, partial [Deltaproteobacteria bacterium CG23_combo_of_CG06-09_8_20_14_all_51_20]
MNKAELAPAECMIRDKGGAYQLNNWGDGFAQTSVHADQGSASVGAPSDTGRTVPVRLKPNLPRIIELIRWGNIFAMFQQETMRNIIIKPEKRPSDGFSCLHICLSLPLRGNAFLCPFENKKGIISRISSRGSHNL